MLSRPRGFWNVYKVTVMRERVCCCGVDGRGCFLMAVLHTCDLGASTRLGAALTLRVFLFTVIFPTYAEVAYGGRMMLVDRADPTQ